MLSDDYQRHEQAEARKPAILNLRVSYKNEMAHKLNTALHFVVDRIGFIALEEFMFISGISHITLNDKNGNCLIIDLQNLGPESNFDNIIFHTDDCLRDYHKYILSGVEFINRPEYNAAGLQVSFIDDKDNCYTLLEERTYTDS